MQVSAFCPNCESHAPLPAKAGASACPRCGHELPAAVDVSGGGPDLNVCHVCGHDELYVQKDFPHWLGLTILLGAVAASFVTYSYHQIAWTWAILVGSAALDGLLYFVVGNVTVCYRCLAQHRGFPPNPEHKPFDLGVGEKHRQERLRRKAANDALPHR